VDNTTDTVANKGVSFFFIVSKRNRMHQTRIKIIIIIVVVVVVFVGLVVAAAVISFSQKRLYL
jgi:flagellar basal body-associated protein FliL